MRSYLYWRAFIKVLKSPVVAYMSPDYAENQEVRQALSYFLPVFCYSHPSNQRLMQKVCPIFCHFVGKILTTLLDICACV